MTEKNTNNDSNKEEHKDYFNNNPNPNFFRIGDKELITIIFYLCGVLISQILDRDIVNTILLLVSLFCFHLFKILKFKLLRFLFLTISIASVLFVSYRIYRVLIPSETPKQNLTSKNISVKTDSTKTKQTLPVRTQPKSIGSDRPYFVIIGVEETQFLVGKYVKTTMIGTNTGKTPAYNVKIASANKFGGTGFYEKEFKDFLKTAKYKPAIISPRGYNLFNEFEFDSKLSVEDSANIKNGLRLWFVVVDVIYTDIFKVRHHTSGCFSYNAKEKRFYFCGDYSKAD